MVTDNQCRDYRASLGREIGETKTKAKDALECGQKKVDKGTFRWTLGLIVVAVIGALSICYWLAFNATNGVHENKAEATGIKAEVKDLKQDFRDYRTEQKTRDTEQAIKLDRILDKIDSR